MINRNTGSNFGHRPFTQLGIFDSHAQVLTDPGPALKIAMREADKEAQRRYSVSRENIVDVMNQMAGQAGITCNGNARKVTISIYNKWLSDSDKHFIPLRLLPIFCLAVRSHLPLEVYASYFDQVHVVSDQDFKKLQWAELEITKRQLSRKSKQLASEVGL